MKNDTSIRAARAKMEEAKVQSEKISSSGQRLPRRYRLYDKIKDHVSLRTVDTVIVVTAVLIVGLLVYGILTRNAQ
jgi:hypothetical protein